MNSISETSQAVLLLTAPLITGNSESGETSPLSLSQYNKLERRLAEMGLTPTNLLGPERDNVLGELASLQPPERLESLLDRGFQMTQALEKWGARGIWVLSRTDDHYPARLRSKLSDHTPPLIYGCGEKTLLENGGLAVVGSRRADEESLALTTSVGHLAAESEITIISGGAKGVDRTAMQGALEQGGAAIGVLADQLIRLAIAPDCRDAIMDGRLTFISLVDPSAQFNVGNAMQRNKIIYALADAALVVSSDLEKGGTWNGALEQLNRFRCCPIYVRVGPTAPAGNLELINRGALSWPEPENSRAFKSVMAEPKPLESQPRNDDLPLFAGFEDQEPHT